MTFTYSGDPTTSTRNKVRFLINDTDSTDVLFTDEELDYLITEWGTNVYEICRAACETPPQAWGRQPFHRYLNRRARNTPTGVGKTFWSRF